MKQITISEVGPRDGLQSVDTILSTEGKLTWIEAEYGAGVREIEVGSFVSQKLLPQMADTAAVVKGARRHTDLVIAVLVPNARGCEAALEAGAHKISIPLSLSETHSLKNVRRDHAQMLEEIAACQALVSQVPEAERPCFEVGLATAFGCTIEGAVDEAFVIDMAARVLELGVAEVGLSDTTGMGNPAQLERSGIGHLAALRRVSSYRRASAQHPRSGSGECLTGGRVGHYYPRQLPGRPGRLPVCSGRQWQYRDRRSGLYARVYGVFNRD